MERPVERGAHTERIKVAVADCAVASGETITTSGLGSCLAVALYDDGASVGGLVHPMLPVAADDNRSERRPERFVDTGVETLADATVRAGGCRERLVAKVAGGAAIVEFQSGPKSSIGDRNVEAVRRVCERLGVPIVAEAVGGDSGRTVRFDTSSGALTVERTDGIETIL